MNKSNVEIFVSIASYKDDELLNTINDLLDKAKYPDNIRIVVFNQTDFNSFKDHELYFDDKNVEVYSMDFRLTRGVSWIRNKIQQFIEYEKYYLQIDAHMRFAKDWDEKFINYLNRCNSKKPVITFYPSGWDLERGIYENNLIKNEIRAFNQKALTSVGIGLNKELCNIDNGVDRPIPGTTTAAGFLFAPISYVKEVPYDPFIFWNYEETDQTLRGFTNGWDFYGIPECLVWHKYNVTSQTPNHFTEIPSAGSREISSNTYAEKKYFNPEFKSKYPLGNMRSLEEFEILNNIKFNSSTQLDRETKELLIVAPYRNREEHLSTFLEKTPKYFDEQKISYDILITELDNIGEWNAGLPCNSLINFIKKSNYKYLYIHHVDVYPVEGKFMFPEDNQVFTHLGDVGSCLMKLEDFLKVGGYKNTYWGWGSEDDNLYNKFRRSGYNVMNINDIESYSVTFDEKFQSHLREFKGINYSTNYRDLHQPSSIDNNCIFDTNHYGRTHSLIKLRENIYKQNVEPLIKAPVDVVNTNLIISYIKDVKLEYTRAFIKSVSYFSGYNYDMVILDASENPNLLIHSELKSFGFDVINIKQVYSNLMIDRFHAFKEYILNNDYKKILHLDFTDVFLQQNPFPYFKNISDDELIISSEGITIKDQSWNSNLIKSYYPQIYDSIADYEVINGGIIGGSPQAWALFVDLMISEYEKLSNYSKNVRGIDQIILLKLLYYDQSLKHYTFRDEVPLVAHLHVYFNDEEEKRRFKDINISRNKVVTDKNGEYYCIVHQYDRSMDMFNEVIRHFNTYFFPLYN
jgi:hypothetical protein